MGDSESSTDEKRISDNIRQFRLKKQLSLEQLAKLSGLTKGYISKIENSEKAPPFSTLMKIATALSTDISFLISSDSEAPEDARLCIVRDNERKQVTAKGTLYGYHYEAMAHKKLGKNMEPYIIIPAFEEKAVFSHEGEEFMYVLEGTHEFIYDNQKYILKKGDSIYFDSAVPHSGRSIGTEEVCGFFWGGACFPKGNTDAPEARNKWKPSLIPFREMAPRGGKSRIIQRLYKLQHHKTWRCYL
jgi:transcriptional regulator with XRE-family HTH domain